MKKVLHFFVAFLCVASLAVNAQNYKYESVPGDPLNARIYTLENGTTIADNQRDFVRQT